MHAIRIARAATRGADKIVKMEGGYHGVHDSVLVSMKPKGWNSAIRRIPRRWYRGGRAEGHQRCHAGGAVQ